ncbi:hypothetical protein PAMP_021395 [Pampus punctatissimus]
MAVAHRGCVVAGFLLLFLLAGCKARIHKLALKNETRFVVHLNTFGFFANGSLDVNLLSLRLPEQLVNYSTYPPDMKVNAILTVVFLCSVNVKALGDQDNILQAKMKAEKPSVKDKGERKRRDAPPLSPAQPNDNIPSDNGQESAVKPQKLNENKNEGEAVNQKKEDKTEAKKVEESSFQFHIKIGSLAEGLYNFNFHYCQNMLPGIDLPYSFTVEVTERNPGGYLSAAEIPLSRLYICMAGVFFTAAMIWVYTLMKHRYSVFKIHWLMAALAFTKSTSLVFHSINYHFINTEGHPIEGWAVMYYITHLLKGALLFITLALIGTGWAFVKYILSDKEKKIFMIVIPLQVLANVAFIIIESTEEGSSEYALWKEILFLVDLICCGAILFPVVWSIRHLQEASSTDGKAAMNLEKLKLFRHYYVMIVCYIYFTRIIAILLKVTMPFQWQWCYEFLVEVSTLIFFVLTGYKFRPASNNPYLQLPQDEEDGEMDEVVTESGALEGISKVKKTSNGRDRQRESTL